jgi:hypothetical protein
MAAPGLPGVTRPCRRRCDETESLRGRVTAPEPGPLALLPIARSPSRPRCRDRWWALTPPVRPLPAPPHPPFPAESKGNGTPAGMLSVAVVVRTRLSPACPHLLFRGATLSRAYWGLPPSPGCGTGSREVPLGGNAHPATAHPSIHGALYHGNPYLSKHFLRLTRRPALTGAGHLMHLTVQASWGILTERA